MRNCQCFQQYLEPSKHSTGVGYYHTHINGEHKTLPTFPPSPLPFLLYSAPSSPPYPFLSPASLHPYLLLCSLLATHSPLFPDCCSLLFKVHLPSSSSLLLSSTHLWAFCSWPSCFQVQAKGIIHLYVGCVVLTGLPR